MLFINWKKNLFLFLYFVLFITSFSLQHQQMCAEFWIQNKDMIVFSSKAVTVVRKRFLPKIIFTLFYSSTFHKVIAMKLTCYCIKIIAIILMFLLKRLSQLILEIGININNLELNMTDLTDDFHFNIDLSIVTKKHFAETLNFKIPELCYLDVEHEIISYEKVDLFYEDEYKTDSFVQLAQNNKPSEPELIIVSHNQESKLHPSITKKFYDSLNEKDRRRYAAIESMRIGHGGQVYISQLFACDRKTIRKGIREVESFPRIVKHDSRIRIRSRRKSESQDKKKLDDAFLSVMENYKAGNPMNRGQLWTNLSRSTIAQKLQEKQNIIIGDHVVKRLLKDHKFGQRKIYKKQTKKSVENRNEQFENIAIFKLEYAELPAISVDGKKKEFLTLYRAGRNYTQKPMSCPDHDFPSYSDGSFTPYGIWDIKKNKGFVAIGVNNSTCEFACDSIRFWWESEGKIVYPLAKQILILCDGGGNNSSRGYLFKYYLQRLANETGLDIRVAHYPPYCSKYNPIEHRMFPHVTRACQGVIFKNYEQAHKYIETTRTQTGLIVNAEIFMKEYEKGRKLTTSEIDSINLYRDDFLGKWNYRILPSS